MSIRTGNRQIKDSYTAIEKLREIETTLNCHDTELDAIEEIETIMRADLVEPLLTTSVSYIASGIVDGNYKGGGHDYYLTERYNEKTQEDLEQKIRADLKSGALDSEMGFESLNGCLMTIRKRTVILIDGKRYVNETVFTQDFGRINREEAEETLGVYEYNGQIREINT